MAFVTPHRLDWSRDRQKCRAREEPSAAPSRLTGMLTRRVLLRSLGLAGTAVAVPTLVSGCGDPAPSRNAASGSGSADIALAGVPRSAGGQAWWPQAATAVRGFGSDLYRRLALRPGNVGYSPYSVGVALAMTWNGAAGSTASEMGSVLRAPDRQRLDEGLNALTRLVESRAGQVRREDGSTATVSLDVASSLWGQRGEAWRRPFLVALARYYGAGMRQVDYRTDPDAAARLINAWTADRTLDRIPQIIPAGALDAMTRLVLVNAIYLKAPWEVPFARELTGRRPFTRGDGSRVDVDLMSSGTPEMVAYGAGSGWQAARLPYAGGQLAMTVVLPDGPLAELEQALDERLLAAVLQAPKPTEHVVVRLPRFRFRLTADLTAPLSGLGMPTAFDPSRADFSAMTEQERLSISAVLHQAFIAVDEHGTEAAAATAVVMDALSGSATPPLEFTADRPFLFVIYDVDTATPLFIGRVSDPTLT